MDIVASPTSIETSDSLRIPDQTAQQINLHQTSAAQIQSQPNTDSASNKPPLLKHVSSPAYSSPLRHHRRNPSTPHQVKESLNARSEYITSQDDGVAEHRINQYVIKQEIGRGSFGAVQLAIDQYGKEYAVKEFSKSRLRKRAQSHILRKPLHQRRRGALQGFNSPLHRRTGDHQDIQESSLDLIKEEIAIMKKLNHPNLVTLIEVLDDPSEDSLYMVMEMCKKGVVMRVGLDQQADPYPDDTCRYWFRDLILGIEYLHAQGIVHRDIKPDNCLITDDDVLKVVDFGVSEMFEKDSEMLTAKSAGSPAFLPPELCVARHGDVSGKAADIWSMGITLYCLKFGQIPFHKHQIFEMYESIRNDTPNISREPDPDFQDLMLRILEKNPAKRIKMPELRQHAWVTKGGTDPLLPESENTAYAIEPPTDAEVQAAITKNMRNLLTVVKAVKKFKALTANKRPPVMSSILGDSQSPNFTLPPSQIVTSSSGHPQLAHRSQSLNLDDRQATEAALAAEGVHREYDVDIRKPPSVSHPAATRLRTGKFTPKDSPRILEEDHEEDVSFDEPNSLPPFLSSLFHARTVDEIGRRGHAHDPLEDQLFLRIGPSTFAGRSTAEQELDSFLPDDVYMVSESPGAADVDIYETAYRDEIERILAKAKEQDKEPQVYLTRRVDAKLLQLSGLAGKLMAHGEEAKSQFRDYAQFTARKAHVAEVSKALREAARAEYEKRRQERKAMIESAKSEKSRPMSPASGLSVQEGSSEAIAEPTEMGSPKSNDGYSSRSIWKAKAVDRSKHAKTQMIGLMDRVKNKNRTKSKDDST